MDSLATQRISLMLLPGYLSKALLHKCSFVMPELSSYLFDKLTCIFTLQSDTKWGGLKGGQVMAQPQPIFARIESQTEEEKRVQAPDAPKKVKKDKLPKPQQVVEA